MFPTDVDRYFSELSEQLKADDVEEGSDIAKTLNRLERALRKDGFSLTLQEAPMATRTKTSVPKATNFTVKAFRVGSKIDAESVIEVFEEIEGWKTRTLDIKGRTFVVVTNAPRWSKKRIKTALSAALTGGGQDIASVGV